MKKVARSETLARIPAFLGLRQTEAAAYVGVSVSNFQNLVKSGGMPPPRRIGGVPVWDVEELYAYFKGIPHVGGQWDHAEPVRDTSWDDA